MSDMTRHAPSDEFPKLRPFVYGQEGGGGIRYYPTLIIMLITRSCFPPHFTTSTLEQMIFFLLLNPRINNDDANFLLSLSRFSRQLATITIFFCCCCQKYAQSPDTRHTTISSLLDGVQVNH